MKRFLRRVRSIRIFKTLRFRLASTFLLLLSLVTVGVGIAGTQLLKSILTSRTEDTLLEELTALRGYLHFSDNGEPFSQVDQTDPEEQSEFESLTSVYVVARDDGTLWRGTTDPAFSEMMNRDMILQELRQIKATKRQVFKQIQGDDSGPYEVISGILTDTAHHRDWYIAIGRSLADNNQLQRRFRRNYFLVFVPITIFLCILASWFSAGRALAALESVGTVAGDITGSNLGLQIPLRGAHDELDRLIGSFNEMSRRLKASFDQIRQFSTDVSHELRTPLTAIQGQLEVALFTAKQPEQLKEAIENALQDVERLSNLVRALLLLSHSETGQLPVNKTAVDLSKMTAELVEQFQIPAEAHDLRLSTVGGDAVVCQVDRIQIERVITNLLSNAIKYTPAGGWIRAWTEPWGNAVKIVVEDSGIGIPADHLPHIFDRFYRVPDPNPEKGLGLGLSFVASIVKAHGGEIQVQSELGKGSRFTVLLPGSVRTAMSRSAGSVAMKTER
jgi:heavy metal sensor kinase